MTYRNKDKKNTPKYSNNLNIEKIAGKFSFPEKEAKSISVTWMEL